LPEQLLFLMPFLGIFEGFRRLLKSAVLCVATATIWGHGLNGGKEKG
jgi:hypothetical protein